MTKIKVLTGVALVAALVALGVGQANLQEPVVAANNDVMAPTFWSTPFGQNRFQITGFKVIPLV